MEINKIYEGNSLEVLKTFPDNSIDTVITDPPYGLSDHDEKTIKEVLSKWLSGEENYVPKKKGFMGKEWDAFVPPPALWKEVYRVMKPGATLLTFAGTRTYDLMTIALRLAGFEIKDTLMWLNGTGFPKAQSIDLMIDKKIGVQHPKNVPISPNRAMVGANYTRNKISVQSTEAKQWQGYETHSLKPAYEPIIMAMKSNEGSYADNALKWQVAGLNIDEARIEYHGSIKFTNRKPTSKFNSFAESVGSQAGYKKPGILATPSEKGRYPTNVIIDEEVGKIIDEQSGISKTVPNLNYKWNKQPCDGATFKSRGTYYPREDVGGASRFFYCAKASRKEREEGLEGLEEKYFGRSGGAQNAIKEGKTEYLNDGIGLDKIRKVKNFHPTVKPIALLRYLVKLTKMPNQNQVYLDPFIGTGTTAIACYLEGRNWIGIELIHEYVEIANARIKYWNAQKTL